MRAGGGEREALVDADVSWLEVTGAVDGGVGDAGGSLALDSDVDEPIAAARRQDAPDPGRGVVAEDRPLPTGEKRRGFVAQRGGGQMPDGEDASMKPDQIARRDPPGDRLALDCDREQLRSRHSAALHSSDLFDPL